MAYEGVRIVGDSDVPHLGGNVREGDPFTYAPSVWNYLVGRFAVKTVLDLGAGLGYSSNYFHRAGAQVVAVDGLEFNVKNSLYPSMLIDLTNSPVICRVDLVHCQEVVEHIEERYVENVLKSLTCGKFIVMTNALPGAEGYHHVNCQPTEYWIKHLKRYGCELMVEDTERVRRLAEQDKAWYLKDTGIVLANHSF
jgi:SAM-dependent methyltransferase